MGGKGDIVLMPEGAGFGHVETIATGRGHAMAVRSYGSGSGRRGNARSVVMCCLPGEAGE